jgi:hypothetical protein
MFISSRAPASAAYGCIRDRGQEIRTRFATLSGRRNWNKHGKATMKVGNSRSVLLVGSVPLKPASEVFRVANHYLAEVMTRYPDGEQVGWLPGVWQRMAQNPALEPTRKVPLVGVRESTEFFSQLAVQYYRVKSAFAESGLRLGPYGIAENAIASYRQFKEMKENAAIPERARFQATLPGPLDCAFVVELPKGELFPLAGETTAAEIAAIVKAIPADDLTIQIDLAVEVEHEEYRRRPQDFDMPVYEGRDWTLDEQATLVANISNRIPSNVELGFHLCSIWHIDQSKGQDNNVHVDWCNALSRKIDRPIGYFHMPTIPEHETADFVPLQRLKLHHETELFLGVIHMDDGLEGASRRIAAATSAVTNFGVSAFCGLAQPSRQEAAHPHTVEEIFELHRKVARL